MSKDLSFEKAMEKLEGIVDNLENGNLNLDEALKAYEEGIVLSQYCNKILEEAEGKIVMITKEEDIYKEISFLEEER